MFCNCDGLRESISDGGGFQIFSIIAFDRKPVSMMPIDQVNAIIDPVVSLRSTTGDWLGSLPGQGGG